MNLDTAGMESLRTNTATQSFRCCGCGTLIFRGTEVLFLKFSPEVAAHNIECAGRYALEEQRKKGVIMREAEN